MLDLALLTTDFDGTLIGEPEAPDELYWSFRRQVSDMRRASGMRWAIVTGRHAEMIPIMAGKLLMHGLAPDFFVMEDARIFRRHGSRYWPFFFWNCGISRRRRQQLRQHRVRVRSLVREIALHHPDAENLAGNRLIDLWFHFPSPHAAMDVERQLLAEFTGNPDFFVFRWDAEVCLAPTAGTKGEAVRKLMAELQAAPKRVLAVGDGQNDISMLDGHSAGLVACVGNATEEVKTAVRRAAGFVAQQPHLHGMMEILRDSWPVPG
jgi:HAD superfamily hydrolase (TIGR01484 family)